MPTTEPLLEVVLHQLAPRGSAFDPVLGRLPQVALLQFRTLSEMIPRLAEGGRSAPPVQRTGFHKMEMSGKLSGAGVINRLSLGKETRSSRKTSGVCLLLHGNAGRVIQ